MDTTSIFFLLLLLLSCTHPSIADVIFRPHDLLGINCGSSTNLSTPEGRNWIGDSNTKLVSISRGSVLAPALTQSTIQGPYTYARISRSNFTYSIFNLTAGPKFLRLFFFSTSYQNFDRSRAFFSVNAGPYTLLQHFNASLHADADYDPAQSNILLREYCINLDEGQKLNISFIPSTTDSYAFINGIEIVSMPSYLYYTNPDVDNTGLPQIVDNINQYRVETNHALETMYRLTVAGREIPPSEDTGMLRTWDPDENFVASQSAPSVDFGKNTRLTFTEETPNYTAPDEVYRSLRNMGTNATVNMGFNLTWKLPVDSGFTYLLRLHFCQLDPYVNNPGDERFYIFIADQLATDWADILLWTGNQKGVPVVREYVVFISGNQTKPNLSLKLHPHPKSFIKDVNLNAIELFKISNPTGSLAEPDSPLSQILHGSNKKSSASKKTLITSIAGAIFAVVFLSFIIRFSLIKRKSKVSGHNVSKQKDGTSRGGGSSSLPTNLCRHFSFAEVRAATNNFDELFVVGVGGFGNVYKGYIDNGSTCVAVKRLKPGSRQGVNEFLNEIEMLSQLRHLHLVSLIGYCYESNEMILVYDFMARGSLRDHLYDTDNPSLAWKQRIQICIGVARGLHYLHTGAKQLIIHRDVKSTNILLDEKWIAKVSDFGLSRIGPTGISMTHVNTQVKGSIGYLDPEYYKRQRLTEKSDVYSFGVVLLEVLCGRQPLVHWEEKQRISLVKWAKHCYEKGSLSKIVDRSLKGQIAPKCLHKFCEIALSCLVEDGTERPSMRDVVGMLEFVLQFHDSGIGEDVLGSGECSLHDSDYSKSRGLSTTTTSEGDSSCGSKEYAVLVQNYVFSEIMDPKGR